MDQELFRMNAHGDIWQEPSLFDQGGDVPAPAGPSADALACIAESRAIAEQPATLWTVGGIDIRDSWPHWPR